MKRDKQVSRGTGSLLVYRLAAVNPLGTWLEEIKVEDFHDPLIPWEHLIHPGTENQNVQLVTPFSILLLKPLQAIATYRPQYNGHVFAGHKLQSLMWLPLTEQCLSQVFLAKDQLTMATRRVILVWKLPTFWKRPSELTQSYIPKGMDWLCAEAKHELAA